MFNPSPSQLEDQDALVPEKKFVDFQRLSVPAIMTSSLAGHFARRAMNGTFTLSIPESAATNELPPFVVRCTSSSCRQTIQSVLGLLDEIELSPPSPKSIHCQSFVPVHFALPLSCAPASAKSRSVGWSEPS